MRRKPYYSNEELNDALTRIERLKRMQEAAERNARLSKAPEKQQYEESYQRLTANIKTSELLYQAMVDKVRGVK